MAEGNYWSRHMLTRRNALRTGVLGGAGVLGAALIGCGSDDDAGTPGGGSTPSNGTPGASPGTGNGGENGEIKRGGELRIQLTSNPQGWDPNLLASQAVVRPSSHALGKLFQQQYGGDIDWRDMSSHPDHIESVEQVDDVTAIWHVRPGITWPDVDPVNGREFNAEDVQYNIEVTKASPGGANFIANPVSSVDVVDEMTVQVNFETPFAPFYIYLASGYQLVRAREVDDAYGDMQAPENLIGTGPWQLESYQPDQEAVFVPNPTYYKGDNARYVDRVVTPVVPQVETQTTLFQGGQLHEWETRDPSLYDSISRSGDYNVLQQLRAPQRVWFQGEPWQDVRMRRALSMAMDYDSYIQGPLRGDGSIAYVFPPEFAGMWLLEGEELGEAAKWHHFNREEARALVEAAGYGGGLTQELYASDTVPESDLALWVEWLAAIGITLNVNTMPYAEWYAYAVPGNFPEGIGASGAKVFFDPDEWLQRIYQPGGSWNGGHIDDPIVNELIERQRTTLDDDERYEALAEVQRYLADQCYVPFVLPNTTNYVLTPPELMNWRRPEAYDLGRASEVAWLDL